MKKTLIALAAVAAVGAASAQVTVYGKLDVAYSNSSAGNSVGLSGWETSRLGVKASDKLGGMTASVVLEGKLRDNTNGQAAFQGFDRTATVGLAGSWGAVTIGNQWTPVDNAIWTTDALEYNGFTPLAAGLWNADGGNTGMGNAKSSIQYATPTMSGFQGFVLIANNVTGNTQGATNYTGLGLNYGAGPLVINYAYQAYDGSYTSASAAGVTPVVAAAQVGTASTKTNVFAINYNVGAANLYGGMVSTEYTATSKETGYTFGVKVPVAKDSVSVGFASNTVTASGKDTTKTGWGAQYIMPLTAKTVAYGGIQSIDSANTYKIGTRIDF